jgi:dihydroxyacetone kinase-like predicted kinase
MEAGELILNIAVNLGRLSRWAIENRRSRIEQFLSQTEDYIKELEVAPKSPRFLSTYQWFRTDFERLRQNVRMDEDWAESMLTWANILTHRASLA